MPLILSGNVASATADAGYTVANSCRFNDGDSAYMHKTPGSAGNQIAFTISLWCKRGTLGTKQTLFSAVNDASNETECHFEADDTLNFRDNEGGSWMIQKNTTQKFRDCSAWYHLVFSSVSGTQKIWVNGVEVTAWETDTNGSGTATWNDDNVMTVGAKNDGSSPQDYFDGYIAEFVSIDGSTLTPTSFGEFDEDSPTIWKPKDVSGLTFGTNGFYLDFEASDNLGNDANGGTDLTEVNLAATDQATDTPTNNFCTWNALDKYYSSATFAEGNTTVVTPNGSITYATGTIGLSSGRWYFEVQPYDPSDDNNIGIVDHVSTSNSSSAGELQYQPRGWCYRQAGDAYNNNSSLTGSWSSYSAGVTIGVFLDLEDNTIYWSRDGVMQNSGTGISITAAASTDTGFYFPAVGDYNGSDDTTFLTNFGGSSSFAISSAVTDDNGYGNFEYTPSVTVDSTAKKFYAICTKNLAEYG